MIPMFGMEFPAIALAAIVGIIKHCVILGDKKEA